MRSGMLLLFALLLLAAPLAAAPAEPPAQEGGVAHGAAKAGAEATRGDSGDTHAERTILGIPEWVWKLANLVIFWGLLGYLVLGPVRRGLSGRSDRIRAELAESRERRTKADQFAAEVEQRLKRLEGEVSVILDRARAEGERQREEMIAAAETEAEKIVAGARNEVDARVKLARKELMEFAGELASERARALVEQSLTDADRHRLFEQSVDEIGQARA
jgi:F-type H+-transporting ATPase subunit b